MRRLLPHRGAVSVGVSAVILVSSFLIAAEGALGAATRPARASLTLSLGTTRGPISTAGIPANLVAPGDVVQRTLDLGITNRTGPGRLMLKVTAPVSSILDRNDTRGLRLAIDGCLLPWKLSGPGHRYTCTGPVAASLATISVAGMKARGATALEGIHLGAVTHLRIRLTLPPSSTNAFQGKTSALRFDLRLVALAP